MDPRADVPLRGAPVLLVAGLDRAGVVRPADEDAGGLRVIDLVEDVVVRVAHVHDAEPAGEQGDGDDRHDRTVESRQRTHATRVPVAVGRLGRAVAQESVRRISSAASRSSSSGSGGYSALDTRTAPFGSCVSTASPFSIRSLRASPWRWGASMRCRWGMPDPNT